MTFRLQERVKTQATNRRLSLWLLEAVILGAVGVAVVSVAFADGPPGAVESYQKISDTAGGFTGPLQDDDEFGTSVASLGDLDGDGVADLAVGAMRDDDGGFDRGAVWILFMNADNTVKSRQKISSLAGGFTGRLDNDDLFGISVAALDDLDGDGVTDLAVGAIRDDDGGSLRGAVWILFLNTDGTVKNHQKISDTAGNFNGSLDNGDQFGSAVADLGDWDNDGVTDMAVGAYADDDGAPGQNNRGALWILFLNADGTVKGHQKISDTAGNFGGVLVDTDALGSGVTRLGDLDQDGIVDLAVGAYATDDLGPNEGGAVWILFMNADGTVKGHQKIGQAQGGFAGMLDDDDRFGGDVVAPGDLDGDGVQDLIVSAHRDDDGGLDRGAIWVLFLNRDGTVKRHQKISALGGNFTGDVDDEDLFSLSLTLMKDLKTHGVTEVAAAAPLDDDGGPDRGAVWVLRLTTPPADLTLTKQVDNPAPNPGRPITYTLTVSNDSPFPAVGAAAFDPLPPGLTFIGPVILTPPQPGATVAAQPGDLPLLAGDFKIAASERVTLTFSVRVDAAVAPGVLIDNTAAVSSTGNTRPISDSVTITISGGVADSKPALYLPLILRQEIRRGGGIPIGLEE